MSREISNFQEVSRFQTPYILLALLPTYIFVGGIAYVLIVYLQESNIFTGLYLLCGAVAYGATMRLINQENL